MSAKIAKIDEEIRASDEKRSEAKRELNIITLSMSVAKRKIVFENRRIASLTHTRDLMISRDSAATRLAQLFETGVCLTIPYKKRRPIQYCSKDTFAKGATIKHPKTKKEYGYKLHFIEYPISPGMNRLRPPINDTAFCEEGDIANAALTWGRFLGFRDKYPSKYTAKFVYDNIFGSYSEPLTFQRCNRAYICGEYTMINNCIIPCFRRASALVCLIELGEPIDPPPK